MNQNQKNKLLYILIPMLCVVIFGVGFFMGKAGTLSAGASNEIEKDQDLSLFWDAWKTLEAKYPFKEPDSKDKLYGAIEGLAASYGDPYTSFFPPKDAKMFNDEISGSFGGIGIELGIKEGLLTVIAPVKDTPAYTAGIKPGDIILKINDKESYNMTTDEAIALIRGDKGTHVILSIAREGTSEPLEFDLIRDTIVLPTLDTRIENDVFIVSLYNFSEPSAKLFADALQEFKKSGLHKFVLDLRGNPGGYLDAAVDMASWFLPQGSTIVRENSGGDQKKDTLQRSLGHYLGIKNLSMIILVDKGSASASEILAGALSEHHVAKLVGEKTFGKGSVQEVIDLPEHTSIKITVAKWFTPNGVSISDHGLTPDYEIELGTDKDTDPQLEKAFELLKAKK